MPLIERLEKRARELDQQARVGEYDQQAADDRDLLLEAATYIKSVENWQAKLLGRVNAVVESLGKVVETNRKLSEILNDQ
jgi:hypothetical protein